MLEWLDPLQFSYRSNRSTDDAIAFTLHTALSHLENKNTYVRMLFVDYSSELNTIVPATLVAKLQTLGLYRSLCSWILDFLTGRNQVVRMGNNTSSPLTLNTGAPQGCVLSPLLYSLYTHDCTATHSSNVIVKFADDTTVIGLITDNNETAYREEVSTLTKWCQENHLSLNIDKTKELVVDFRRQSRVHTPISSDKTPVEQVSSFKFLCGSWGSYMVCSHRCSAEEGTSAPLLPETADEVWNDPQHPQILLHLHFGEHPDQLHHRLVWKRHRWQPQSSAKGRANCPPYCWRWVSLPPGHLHQPVYKESQEDHQGLQPPVPQSALSAALRKTSPQHPIPH